MTDLVTATREAFWRDLIFRFERRARPYCRRLRCSEDEVEELLWDLWQEAAEHEAELVASSDQWPLLLGLLRQLCATRVRSWRREFRLEDDNVHVSHIGDDEALCGLQIREWKSRLLAQLPQQQRQAIDFRFCWGWPYWAVAAAIGTAEPTARVHVARGIRRLRELAEQCPPPAD